MTANPATLRARSEAEGARFPPLLARADQLAGAVLLGDHGRRRAGTGDDFWQFRPAQPGDSRRMIDHRRSAIGDTQFVREREWQIAQSVMLWIDQGASMRYTSDAKLPEKIDRARLLGMTLAILLVRGGERVGLTGTKLPPRRGRAQILQLAQMLSEDDPEDYARPEHRAMIPHAGAVFISDFMAPLDGVEEALSKASARGVRGGLLQVLDPIEEAFPFRGGTRFNSAGGTIDHESLKASDLRGRYLERLRQRKARLAALAATAGWQFNVHHTNTSAQSALLWLWRMFDQGRART